MSTPLNQNLRIEKFSKESNDQWIVNYNFIRKQFEMSEVFNNPLRPRKFFQNSYNFD